MYEVRTRKLCVFALVTFAASAQTEAVRLSGRVQDPSGGNPPGVCVSLKPVGSSERVAAVLTDDSGEFTFTGLAPQAYDLSFTAFGFKRRSLNANLMQRDNTISPVVLELVPAVIDYGVDSLIAYEARRLKDGRLELHSLCAVDLDDGRVDCPVGPDAGPVSKGDDFRVEREAQEVYITAINGATIAPVETTASTRPETCRSPHYSLSRIRIDNLPAGSRVCMRTNQGHAAELDLSLETVCIAGDVYLAFVTWKP
jgi:hypothetical protein